MPLPLIKVAVRQLVDFVLRSGDLANGGFGGAARLSAGLRAHQQVQRSRPAGYQAEVKVSHRVETDRLCLEIDGRIDGLLIEDGQVLLEEIKTTCGKIDPERSDDPLHWAQAKTYAYILSVQHELEQLDIQLTYVGLEPWTVREDRRTFTRGELTAFFTDLIARYLHWACTYRQWCDQRDQALQALTFPFPEYRPGQRPLAVAAYRTIAAHKRLFVQAPTGIGKTISVLFPALKAMGRGLTEKIFYLTAKTIGRTVAEKAVDDLRRHGLALKSLSLTARGKICFKEDERASCKPEECPFAHGYYDRINGALEELFLQDAFTRPRIEEVARRHQVCPFEFSLELSLWVELIICDYNYVFDPRAYLKRFFLDTAGNYTFLIDEAHNLVDRAREMFSAELSKKKLLAGKRAVGREQPGLVRQLRKLNHRLLDLGRRCQPRGEQQCWISAELPADLLPLLESCLTEAEKVLGRNIPFPYWDELLELYFELFGFRRIAELYDEHYVAYAEKQGQEVRLRLFCLDPSSNVREALRRGTAAVFFSATLTPLEYFRQILGGEPDDSLLSLNSPFPHENLRLLLADQIATTYQKRSTSYDQIAEAIEAFTHRKRGNYLVYFPSYQYLQKVIERFTCRQPEADILIQTSGMSEPAREAFLATFASDNPRTVVGFAVLGGIFGEGIDLAGERLVGALIIGVGLPQLCLERELIRQYFDARQPSGFDYAYTYPGMTRVLQAAGRVIRSATDRGAVLLIDQRFSQRRYRRLLPAHWRLLHRTRTPEQIGASLELFWNGGRNGTS